MERGGGGNHPGHPGRGRGGGGGRNHGGGRGGRGGGRSGGGGYDQNYQNQYRETGGGGGGGGGGYGRGRNSGGGGRGYDQNYQAQYQYRESGGGYDQNFQAQYRESGGGGGRGGGRGRGYDNRPPQQQQQQSRGGGDGSVGRGVWKQSPSASSSSSNQPQQQQVWSSPPIQPPIADSVETSFKSLKISEGRLPLDKVEGKSLPIRRPDHGTLAVRSVRLLANHFPVAFNPKMIVMHYDVEIKQVAAAGNRPFKKSIPKHLMHAIKDKLFSDSSYKFPVDMVTYDGEKNIFSAVELPVGVFKVDYSDAEDTSGCSYALTIKEVSQLELGRLKEYLGGKISYIPRDILQSLDLVMKDNPSKCRINVGKSFYCKNYRKEDDLGYGLAAYRGLYQSLKPTSQGLALCLDYSVLAFRKPLPILEYLEQCGFRLEDISKWKGDVIKALKGLKVTVTHRRTKQKYIISGLTTETTRELSFQLVSPDSSTPPKKVLLVDYFWQKYEKRIKYLDIPCLDIGKPGKPNHVPMEFCVLLEGQRYPKEDLDRDTAAFLRHISLAKPESRKQTIYDMVRAKDGPCGAVAKNFDLEVEKNMTKVTGRVLGAPVLKLRELNGNVCRVTVDQDKCHWNLTRHSVAEGQSVERWALIDFTFSNGNSRMKTQEFIGKLKARSSKLGMRMADPMVHFAGMHELSSVSKIERLLNKVVADATQRGCRQDKQLQVIVCVMSRRDPGYGNLKWVSEVKIGIITQCCLLNNADRAQDQFLANLCLKINAKVGGSNVELNERLPHFSCEDKVMFIGADVNHPAASNSTCPSIAAVVGSINWPATNRYAAKIQPQEHRKEKILNFGSICRDLINTYAQHNGTKPEKIIVFRDGVSESQFDMVLNEELVDMVKAISDEHYQPFITLVVAQKRHHTRLFSSKDERYPVENVPPGTVVDTTIVHPFEFDFYLCSHLGSIGTSKPTHYYVLWDDNGFTSDELQKLIYNLCFTYARCTKPVSLVPPVYYADLVAYRGRLFQEVIMEDPQVSRSSRDPVASSFDHEFYNLHSNLRDVMHFI